MANEATNGPIYRSLINGCTIPYERSVSFEPNEIKITIYTNYQNYLSWLKRKDEEVNFRLTNTDVSLQLVIYRVILVVILEEVVEVVLKLVSSEWIAERQKLFQ